MLGAPFGGKFVSVTNVENKIKWLIVTLKPINCFVLETCLEMSSRKCYVCNSKTSSRWFRISEEITEDVCKCFNVKVIESQEDLCASCRRNLTRWREGPTNASKYFVSVNSREQPCINRSKIARKNRKTAILRGTSHSHELSPLVTLPEDLFLFIAEFLSVSDVSRLRQTCRYANLICQLNILWKLLLRRDFPEQLSHLDETVLSNSLLSYKILFSSKWLWESHHAAISDHVTELASMEINLLEENQAAQHRFSNLKARLQSLQMIKIQERQSPNYKSG